MISPSDFRKPPRRLNLDKEQLRQDLEKLIPTITFMCIRGLRTQAKHIQKFQRHGIKNIQPALNYGLANKILVRSAWGEYDVMDRKEYTD